MADFFNTRMGAKFYESTMPRIADALDRIADSLEHPKDEKIIEMALCEAQHIVPRSKFLYRFVEFPDCDNCKAIAETYRKEDY